jgi:hypothetical protein
MHSISLSRTGSDGAVHGFSDATLAYIRSANIAVPTTQQRPLTSESHVQLRPALPHAQSSLHPPSLGDAASDASAGTVHENEGRPLTEAHADATSITSSASSSAPISASSSSDADAVLRAATKMAMGEEEAESHDGDSAAMLSLSEIPDTWYVCFS